MLAQHGREPFRGPRRILTIMSTPYSSLASADVPPTPFAPGARRCCMSASFSAPRLRPRQLSAGDLVEEEPARPGQRLPAHRPRAPAGHGPAAMDRRRRRRATRQPAAAWRHPVPWLRGGRRGGLLPGRARLFAEHARLPGARGGAPGSGAPGVHFHRVLAGWLDSAAPRNVLLAQLAELHPLLLPDAARHPGPHAPGRRAPGQRPDTRGDQAALPPPWGVLRAQLRAGDRPDLAGRLPDRQPRRGRGLLAGRPVPNGPGSTTSA
ncbi:hypothetical protein P4133_00940 [Pseudomonas aeruginosa]|nr:hypothetical protein [Pseudomonas aeruginosa]